MASVSDLFPLVLHNYGPAILVCSLIEDTFFSKISVMKIMFFVVVFYAYKQ